MGDFPGGPWQASWIWCGWPAIGLESPTRPVLLPDAADRRALLRRSFTLDRVPRRAPARMTADSRCVVSVNGVEVSRGPARGNPRRLSFDVVDLAPYLREGQNALAASVHFYGFPIPWWMPAAPTYTLGAGSFVLEARLGDCDRPDDRWILTDDAWKALPGNAWQALEASRTVGAGLSEVLDARLLPVGWREPGFDDSAWPAAHVILPVHLGAVGPPRPPSPPYGRLVARAVPQLEGELRHAEPVSARRVEGGDERVDPVHQVDTDEQSTAAPDAPVELHTLDFGHIVAGTAVLDVDVPAGTTFDVSFSEALTADGRLARLGQHTGFRYTARGSHDHFETGDLVGGRFVRIAVRAPSTAPTAPTLAVHERHRPRPGGPFFQCSDPLLDRVYAVGLRTVDLCAHDAYVDCPTREQRAWTGDAVVHQMVDLAANPDWSLARWHPQLTASPRPDGMLPMAVAGDFEWTDATIIPDWPLHWIRSVHNLWRYTGDRDLVASLLPAAEGVLRWFLPFRGDDGLVHDVTGWVLIDWSSVHVQGTSSALNALWARALRDFEAMAGWLGDAGRAAWARHTWEQLVAGFERFWDDERSVYVDHLVDGERRRPVSQHGSAAALCAGLVPAVRVDALVATITDRARLVRKSWVMDRMTPEADGEQALAGLIGPPPSPDWDVEREIVEAQPFFRYVVHDAVADAGRPELVAGMCRDWSVFLDRGETSWPETWFGGTHCHGWSSTPTRDLVVRTLGITPAEPGFAVACVAPRLGDLDWAAGAAPTPRGLVTVRADIEKVEVDSPVPVAVDLGDGAVRRLAAGSHKVARDTLP